MLTLQYTQGIIVWKVGT